MAAPLIIRAVLDAAGYLKVSESVVSSNTLMAESALGMGADFTKSAEAQVAAGAKVIASQRAQLTQLKAIQAESIAGSDRRVAADVAVAKAQSTLNRSMGITAERDLGKLSRGALAGTGLFSKLGRSLAFASTGFIAVAGGATLIAESIRQAETLQAAQRQVDQQLKVSGKSWATYGTQIDAVLLKEGHLAGFTRAQLLQAFGYLIRVGGNVQQSLHLTALAADVARGRSITLQAASIALAKALGGSATALRRLGIIVPNNVTKMQALEYVQEKFAGQAEAGTKASDRLSASLSDAGATIGTALLPTFERLATEFSDWLQKMNSSGRITSDVNTAGRILGGGFHTLESAIKAVDDVTGSFTHTLVIVGEVWAGIKVAGWIRSLGMLATQWGLVESAAKGAAVAEGAAGVAAAGAGAAGAAGAAGSVASRVAPYTAAGSAALAAAKFGSLAARGALIGGGALLIGAGGEVQPGYSKVGSDGHIYYGFKAPGTSKMIWTKGPKISIKGDFVPFGPGGQPVGAPDFFRSSILFPKPASPKPSVPFSTAPKLIQNFSLSQIEQLDQAQAALTRSTTDDVKVAKAIVGRVKKLISEGRLKGKQLIDGLNAEASALSTIWSAEDAAAQKRAAAAQTAKDRIAAQIQDSIDPLRLEVALSKAQAEGKSVTTILRRLRAAAEKALKSGKLSLEQQKEAWDQITSINQQLSQQNATAIKNFKQLNTRRLTEGLGLTARQRALLRARLSQVGHGGTVPRNGVGAYGFQIGHNDRPIHIHNHNTIELDGKVVARSTTKDQQRHRRRNSHQRRGPNV